ncbi:hypothetical protein XENOCAPTIV_010273 [Xenoophorus captivus]|uniref:Uncharacterized protein n=1 Tax=Xenoophorus captivus TaxID=1517983 RepID=A0ABV0R3K7_9TELE
MVACSVRNVSMLKLKQINVCSCGTCVCGLAMEVLTKSSIQARISINTSNATGGFIGVDEIMINPKYESVLIQNLQVCATKPKCFSISQCVQEYIQTIHPPKGE